MSEDARPGDREPTGGPEDLPLPPPPPPPRVPPAGTGTVTRGGIGRRAIALGVGVALLAGGLVFAVSQAGSGGASSPESAVEDLFDALSDEDILGLLDVLPAGERRAMLRPIQDLSSELQRIGVLGPDTDLSGISGIDLEFDDLVLTSEPLADGIVKVHLTGGTLTTNVDPDDLPLGDALLELIEEVSGEPLEIDPVAERTDLDPDRDSLELVTVQDGGAWKVSLFYSVAEAARLGAGLPPPFFGSGVAPRGAPSPEAAVEAILRAAVEDLDLEAVIAMFPPDEMAALHDYAPLFLDDIGDLREAIDVYSAELRSLDLSVDRDGDEALVVIDQIDLTVEAEHEGVAFSFDGECVAVSFEYEDAFEQCLTGPAAFTVPFGGAGPMDLPELPLRDDPPAMGISTVRVGGEWYVSPTRSLLGLYAAAIGALDDDVLDALPEFIDALFEGLFGFGYDDEYEFEEVGEAIGGSAADDSTTILVREFGLDDATAGCVAASLDAAGFHAYDLYDLFEGALPPSLEDELEAILDSCEVP